MEVSINVCKGMVSVGEGHTTGRFGPPSPDLRFSPGRSFRAGFDDCAPTAGRQTSA